MSKPVFHVIDSDSLREALQRAIDSGDADLTYVELYANGEADACVDCGHQWAVHSEPLGCSTCGCTEPGPNGGSL